ncbi:MAG: hypothetical protein QM730_10825 [Anaerolineales bacterium]
MKKVIFLCLVITSFALTAGIVSCLSSQATALPQPSVTHTVIELLTSTPSITATPKWTGNYDDDIATVAAAQTHAANFPRICDEYYPHEYSPNGLWLVEMCGSQADNDLILAFSNRETRALWKLLYHDYIPNLGYSPDGGLEVIHWSQDGKYAYFYSHGGGDGGECFYGEDSGFGLFRLDLQAGQVTTILPTNEDFWWYGFSVSPVDNYIVYGKRAYDWHILDIESGELIRVNSPKAYDEDGGGFVWSPDGLEFVYSAVVSYPPSNRESDTYFLRWVDTQSGNERVLLEAKTDCFLAVDWNEDNILTVEDYGRSYEPTLIEIDLNSKIVTNATATP